MHKVLFTPWFLISGAMVSCNKCWHTQHFLRWKKASRTSSNDGGSG